MNVYAKYILNNTFFFMKFYEIINFMEVIMLFSVIFYFVTFTSKILLFIVRLV